MIRKMEFARRSLLIIYLFVFLMEGVDVDSSYAGGNQRIGSKIESAYDVIAAVNQVRSANGLSAYQVNGALMAAAQAHSEYQASIGSITHTGSGGSNATGRGMAAGYGGGASVSVVENIYGGMNASPQQAVSWWQGDSLHLNTLLSTKAVDAGAGVATAGGVVYYTLDVGYVIGSEGSGSSSSSGSSSTSGSGVPSSTVVAFYPVVISTPGPDGSVVHVVQPGQTLWSIAASYKISLPDLLTLNGFTSSTFIYPGQKIILKSPGVLPGSTSTATASSQTPTQVRELTTTMIPSPVTEVALLVTTGVPASIEASEPSENSNITRKTDPLLFMVGILVFGGFILLVVGFVLQRRK